MKQDDYLTEKEVSKFMNSIKADRRNRGSETVEKVIKKAPKTIEESNNAILRNAKIAPYFQAHESVRRSELSYVRDYAIGRA